MSRSVEIAAGKSNVQLPNGGSYDAGDVVVLTDEEFAQIDADLIPGTIIDNGGLADDDLVNVQAATVAAPAALTSSAPAALTSAALTGGESPTEAEHNALQADVAALHADLTAAQADVAALRTTVANLLTALKGAGKPMAP